MTEPNDPLRLLDAADGVPEGLRDVLRSAERDVGSEQEVARLAARLGPLLGAPAAAPTSGAASSMSGAVKLGLTAVALIAVGGGAWLLSTQQTAPNTAARSAPLSAPAASPAQALPRPGDAPAPEAPALPVAPEPSAFETRPGSSSIQKAPHKPPSAVQLSESELLEQARSALKSDPRRALARANEHRSRFPGGVLVQEREVIAIKALRQLGLLAEAERRTQAFQKAFPGSAFQRKLKPSP